METLCGFTVQFRTLSPKQFKALHNSLKLVFGITWKIDDYPGLWSSISYNKIINGYTVHHKPTPNRNRYKLQAKMNKIIEKRALAHNSREETKILQQTSLRYRCWLRISYLFLCSVTNFRILTIILKLVTLNKNNNQHDRFSRNRCLYLHI